MRFYCTKGNASIATPRAFAAANSNLATPTSETVSSNSAIEAPAHSPDRPELQIASAGVFIAFLLTMFFAQPYLAGLIEKAVSRL